MVLGLIWFFISYVSCWGNLGVIFLRERETLALSSMATPQSGCYWWIGNIQESHFLKRSKSLGENEESLMVSSYSSFSFNLFLSSSYSRSGCPPLMFDRFSWLLLEIFLLSFLSMKDFCFGWVGSSPQIFIWGWSSYKLMRRKSCPASLYQWKTCGAASRAAKSPPRLLLRKTWGIFSFQSANISGLLFPLNFPRRLLFERQWVGG